MAASDSIMSMPSKPSKLPRLSISLPRLRLQALPWIASVGLHASFAGALAYVNVAPSESPAPPEPVAVVLVAAGGGGGGGSPDAENVAAAEAIAPPPPPPAAKPAHRKRPAPAEKVAAGIPAIPEVVEEIVEEVEPEVVEAVEDVVEDVAEVAERLDDDADVVESESTETTAVASNDTRAGAAAAFDSGSGGDAAGPGTRPGAAPGWVGDGAIGGSPFGFAHGDAIDVAHAATAPRVIRQTPPEYPRRARSAGVEGLVVVRAIVDQQGRVESDFLRVLRSVPSLDDAALDAVKAWRFSPARDAEGRPIRVIVKIPVRFALR